MKKILITEVGGENCPCRIYEVLHSAIIGYTCGRDKEVCDKERCSNCPHGKTLSEMAEIASKDMPIYLDPKDTIRAAIKALLGGEEQK